MEKGILTEEQAQELIDHMVMKFRMVKFARIPSYNELFSGDPVWASTRDGRYRNGRTPHGNKERLSFPSIHWRHGTVT